VNRTPPPGHALDAYRAGDPTVTAWFGGPWRKLEDLHAAAPAVRDAAAPAGDLGAILAARDDDYTRDRAARDAVAGLATGAAVAVVCGQQPSYGIGPSLVLAKIAHALDLAARLEDAGTPAVAVFWCASEDHDLGEADHADLVDRRGRIDRRHREFHRGGPALRHHAAAPGWLDLRGALRRHCGPGPGGDFLDRLAPTDGEALGAWTCRVLHAAFAGTALVCVEGHDLRPLWREHLRRAVGDWPREDLAARRAEVLAAGVDDAFGDLSEPPLFLDRTDVRRPLAGGEIADALAAHPDECSPGAALRPVLQQRALPAVAYCGGPGEWGYHAFLGPCYRVCGLIQPRFVPRPTITVVPPWLRRACEGWNLPVATLLDAEPPAIDPEEEESPGERDLAARIAEFAAEHRDDDLRGPAYHLAKAWAGVERARARQFRRAAGLHSPGEMHAVLRPRGRPQERTLSAVQLLHEHGPGITDEMVASIPSHPPPEAIRLDI